MAVAKFNTTMTKLVKQWQDCLVSTAIAIANRAAFMSVLSHRCKIISLFQQDAESNKIIIQEEKTMSEAYI